MQFTDFQIDASSKYAKIVRELDTVDFESSSTHLGHGAIREIWAFSNIFQIFALPKQAFRLLTFCLKVKLIPNVFPRRAQWDSLTQ